MHEIWAGLFQLLLEGVGWSISQAAGGGDAYSPTELDALGTELRQLEILLAEYGLNLEVRIPAQEALRTLMTESVVTAPELVMRHIREPLSALIAEDALTRGDTVVVDCIDGVFSVGRAAGSS